MPCACVLSAESPVPGGCSTPCCSLHCEAWVWSAGIVLPQPTSSQIRHQSGSSPGPGLPAPGYWVPTSLPPLLSVSLPMQHSAQVCADTAHSQICSSRLPVLSWIFSINSPIVSPPHRHVPFFTSSRLSNFLHTSFPNELPHLNSTPSWSHAVCFRPHLILLSLNPK